MRQKRKFLSVLLVFALALPMIFGTAKDANAKEATPEEILTKMDEVSKDLKNVDATMKMNIKMSSQGESLTMKMTADMVVFSDPLKMKMDMNMDLGPLGSQKVKMYYGMEGKKAYIYMGLGNMWQKQQIPMKELENAINSYDVSDTTSAYMQNLLNFKKVSDSTKVNGKDTVVLKGKISGKAIQKLIEATNMLNSISSADDEIDTAVFKNVKGFTIKIYVDKKTMQPVKMSMDLKQYMQSVMKNMTDEIGTDIKISNCTLDLIYNELENVKDFTIPNAALKAEEIK